MNEPYDNELRGVLFKADKQGIETRADYRGQAQINNVDYWVDAWLNTSRKGEKFLSLRFKSKAAAKAQGDKRTVPLATPKPLPRTDEFIDDDLDSIPF